MSINPGCIVSHTKQFLKFREEQKSVVSDILAQRIEAIESKYKSESNSYDVNTLFSSLIGQGHCYTCGDSFTFYNAKILCCVCKSTFCSRHVKPILIETIIEAMDLDPEKNFSCEKCALILEYQATNEEKRKIRDSLKNSKLMQIYSQVNESKQMLNSLMMQFEYLADSITEVKANYNRNADKEDASWGASYNASKLAEKKIMANLNEFQDKLKLIQTYPPKEGSEKLIVKNVNFVFLDFLKNFLPHFKDTQKKIARVELNHVSKVYLFIKQLEFETKCHAVFRGSWGQILKKAIEEVQKEVTQITLTATGETDWSVAKESLEKRVKRREKSIRENPTKSLLAPQKLMNQNNNQNKEVPSFEAAISVMVEPLLMKKVTKLIKQMSDRFSKRRIQAPVTNKVLEWLLSELEKEFESVTTSMK